MKNNGYLWLFQFDEKIEFQEKKCISQKNSVGKYEIFRNGWYYVSYVYYVIVKKCSPKSYSNSLTVKFSDQNVLLSK